ncbi:MAG: MBOAT family protein [Methylobacteriaceae bacterium]|nr:MBOAT family protein [Methylobacteriaceae bacterium]
MVFSSNIFLFVFLPSFLLLYVPTPRRYKNHLLLLANLLFYALGTGTYVLLLAISVIANYVFARIILRLADRWKTYFFWLSVVFNLSFLVYYKYTAFLLGISDSALHFFGVDIPVTAPELVLPLGISFFTFQAISYLADVYLEQVEPTKSLVDFGTYHSLFPQLLAGPIVRYSEVAAQVVTRNLTWEGAAEGTYRFTLGLGKKLLIANPIGSVSDAIFALPQRELGFAVTWLGAFSYALQVYYDFSGYSDMAIGLGRMLGFKFPENFNQPFRAQSITEFWRRWHITLFRWFRDYLFIPLGGSRPGLRSYLALVFVFALCGLWHGPTANYLAWGVYQGILMAIERFVAIRYGKVQHGLWAMVLTFGLSLFGFAVIRCADMSLAWYHMSVMVGISRPEVVYYPIWYYLEADKQFVYAVAIFFAWFPVERLSALGTAGGVRLAVKYASAFVVMALSVISLSASSFNPFIYFRF